MCVFDEVMNWRDEAVLLRDFELSAEQRDAEVKKFGVSNPFVEANTVYVFLKTNRLVINKDG